MPENNTVTNVVFAGLGGQGVLKASDILAEAAFRAGFDVKKSELHGMSQRGGSITSDVRFGGQVFSPMIPDGKADYLVVLEETQLEIARPCLGEGGTLIAPDALLDEGDEVDDLDHDDDTPLSRRNFNVALLGVLSAHLDIPEEHWLAAIFANLPEKAHDENKEVFLLGREAVG